MSELFREVKADIEKEIKETNFHTAASWADIMLHNSVRLTSMQDQHSFWKWVTGNKEREREGDGEGKEGKEGKEERKKRKGTERKRKRKRK